LSIRVQDTPPLHPGRSRVNPLTVELPTIKDAILELRKDERLALEEWLADQREAQMEKDFSPTGRGIKLVEQVDAEIALR
jgi:hypothetical protein